MKKKASSTLLLSVPSLPKRTNTISIRTVIFAIATVVVVTLAHAANAFNPRAKTDVEDVEEAGPNPSFRSDSDLDAGRKSTEDKRKIEIETISIGIGKRVKKVNNRNNSSISIGIGKRVKKVKNGNNSSISIGNGKRVKKVKNRNKSSRNKTSKDVCKDKHTKKTYPEGEAWPLPGCRRGKCIENGKDPKQLTVQVSECVPPKVKEGCKINTGNPVFPFPLCCPNVSCEISSSRKNKTKKTARAAETGSTASTTAETAAGTAVGTTSVTAGVTEDAASTS